MTEQPPNPETECDYTLQNVDNTITMTVLCKSCSRKNIVDRNCFGALLRAFANETNVDKIVLANHVETTYFGKALQILKSITALSYEMTQLSLRVPATPEGEILPGCGDCRFYPQKIFKDLNESFLKDVGLFYGKFHSETVLLYEHPTSNTTCGECILATREDFDYIYSRFETVLRDIVKEGYAVVV